MLAALDPAWRFLLMIASAGILGLVVRHFTR